LVCIQDLLARDSRKMIVLFPSHTCESDRVFEFPESLTFVRYFASRGAEQLRFSKDARKYRSAQRPVNQRPFARFVCSVPHRGNHQVDSCSITHVCSKGMHSSNGGAQSLCQRGDWKRL